MTLEQWLMAATIRLCAANVDSPRLSSLMLLGEVSGLSRVEIITHPEAVLLATDEQRLEGLLRRREQGEPVAYLLGRREFFGRDFLVNPATLIPRPETELLVEYALQHLPAEAPIVFADWGTGSGCIAVTLCAERPLWRGVCVDISTQALKTAQKNALRHGVTERLQCVRANFAKPLFAKHSLNAILSNPPYVSAAEHVSLSLEVRDYEPRLALVPDTESAHEHRHDEHGRHIGGAEGLELLQQLIPQAAYALQPSGLLLVEHGCTQGEEVQVLLSNHSWEKVCCNKDLAGLDRFASALSRGNDSMV